jgi:hypothetical protein
VVRYNHTHRNSPLDRWLLAATPDGFVLTRTF